MNDQFVVKDKMMISFAKALESRISRTAHHCKQTVQQVHCSHSLMEVKNEAGIRTFETYLTMASQPHSILNGVANASVPNQPKQQNTMPVMNNPVNTKLAICANVKDEAPYLAEWIEHHKLIGFDSILLYNDGSTDDTQCILDAYA
jgi:hypothetical protein